MGTEEFLEVRFAQRIIEKITEAMSECTTMCDEGGANVSKDYIENMFALTTAKIVLENQGAESLVSSIENLLNATAVGAN